MKQSFGVIGGDRRQAELARLLTSDGRTVYTYGLEKWKPGGECELHRACAADVVILPLPLCKEEGILNCQETLLPTKELFSYIAPKQIVLAGQVKPQQQKEARDRGIRLQDYFLREELIVANAAATAEGAIQVALDCLDRTLLGMDCLVLGFGRIGKLLSYRLHGLGARVTAAARKPQDLAWIRAYGWQALNVSCLHGCLNSFGAVFNTIPSLVLDESLLCQLSPDCLCVDLASVQGIDSVIAKNLGLQTIWARSLPGRMVPCTAAAAIRDAIYYMILEE